MVRRFISADSISYLGADETVTGFNLFVYCGNNPVIGYDPTGHWDWGGVIVGASILAAGVIALASCGTGTPVAAMLVATAVATTGAVTTYAAATDSAMVVDVSAAAYVFTGKKAGASIVIDFKEDEANLFSHGVDTVQNSVGINISYSVGMVSNYTKPEDYAGPFVSTNVGLSESNVNIGLEHCWNPKVDYGIATKATTISFGGGISTLQFLKPVNIGYSEEKYLDPQLLFSW